MALVWKIVEAIVVVVATVQFACFVVALYEMLNAPQLRMTRLTAASLLSALRGLVVETAGAIVAVLATPLGALPWRRPDSSARPPIVFVPGYCMTRSSMWILRLRLARAGWKDAIGYNYRTVHGDLRAAARGLGAQLDAVRAERGAAHVVVIAHGMGGLVARLCLRERAHGLVRTLVTLGTPHQGSKLYALALDPMAQDMRAGSALVEELAADELPRRVDVTTIYSSFDLTVVPSSAAQYPGAGNIEVEGVGHVGLLWSGRVAELVRENLEFAYETLRAESEAGASGDDQDASSARTQRATSSASE